MKPKYFYNDNWVGKRHEFTKFGDARKSALGETGSSIAIIRIKDNKITHVPASGNIPA